ncbi:MAG TPA: carbohydrate ABC transporter permease, partial [Clostridiaceae bacterium]|nr:carbohydrate ABC transporter permease [Clostridiaceae bacterium]
MRRKSNILPRTCFYLVLILITAIFLFPVYMIFVSSLKTQMEIFTSPFSLPKSIEFSNYIRAWERIDFDRVLLNSFIMTSIPIIGLIILGSMAAYVCARNQSKIVNMIFTLFVSCIIVPFHTAMTPLVKFMSTLRLSDKLFG